MSLPYTRPPRLIDQVAWCCRRRNYSPRTLEAYTYWTRRYVTFHGKLHPSRLGEAEVRAFLDSLVAANVAASTHSQALNALVFLYRDVLELQFPWLDELARPKRPQRLPVVLSQDEVARVLAAMQGVPALQARLIYGSGLRLRECVELRVKDLAWAQSALIVRGGKGAKDRLTLLPKQLKPALDDQVRRVAADLRFRERVGTGYAPMPMRMARKYPRAARGLPWQFLFPAATNTWNGELRRWERWHASPSTLQREFRAAVQRSGIAQPATVHTLRHAFATHLLRAATDVRTLQQLLGHAKLDTTMIYTHVADAHRGVASPLDVLAGLPGIRPDEPGADQEPDAERDSDSPWPEFD